MNWYKQSQYGNRGSAPPKSPKWEEVEANKEAIQNMLNEGYTKTEIAPLFDVSRDLFSKMLSRFKISRDKNVYLDKVRELLTQGFMVKDIAKKLRTTPNTISKFILKNNLRDIPSQRKIQWYQQLAKSYLLPPEGDGLSTIEVSQKFNTSPGSVNRALVSLGLKDKIRTKSETSTKMWENNEERRQNMSDLIKKRWEDEEYRKKMSEQSRKYWENIPGGFNAWIQSFSPQKQNEIMTAIYNKSSEPIVSI